MFRFGDPGGRIYTSAANVLAYWTASAISGATFTVSAGNGRSGGSCLRFAENSSGQKYSLTKTLDSQATLGIAAGIKWSAVPTASYAFMAIVDVTTTQIDLRVNADGTFSVTRNGTVLATSTNAISSGVYYHIELKATIHNSAGNYEVRVNGTSTGWIPAQGGTANTRASANNSGNIVGIGISVNQTTVSAGNHNLDYDDVIVWDAQTTDTNGFADIHDFIGDRALIWLLPSGAGTTTQFTPDSGSNYARVNEATPDGDTSYVEDATVNDIDTYAITDLVASASSIQSLAVITYAKKTDVGSRGMKTELRSASANASHATEIALSNSYTYYFQTWAQDPNNGSATNWTPTTVNALEAGQKVSS